MYVLIVEQNHELGVLWKKALARQGAIATLVSSQDEAIAHLRNYNVDVIVLDVMLTEGSAFAVSDFANYRRPKARVIFVTNTSFFSDGSIFQHCSNACAFVQSASPPEDLAAMVQHYGAN
jgi:DNA-binding response OmpR family regulator